MSDFTENLRRIWRDETDFSLVCEIYSSDAVPGDSGFDPNDAIKRYASVSGITFYGASYERRVSKFGNVRRTITAEVNSASVDFCNLLRDIAEFEFDEGFEGLILVVRLISRSESILLTDSQIWFAGRCEKPKSGTKEKLSVSAKHILGSTDSELPRRKFTSEDAEGRVTSDKLFEGFIHIPRYGVSTYQVREKRGGLLGLLGFKKTVTKTLPWSSFSDLDAEKYLPEVFGRMQVIGTHIGYADVGTDIQMVTAFCEGEIEGFSGERCATPGFSLNFGAIARLRGLLGGVGDQLPDPDWVAPGYYSRTAHLRCDAFGTAANVADPAPDVVAVILGKKIYVPDASGDWVEYQWSDDGTAQTRFLLTSPDYYKLHQNWIDDESFTESYKFNNEIIFDSADSDLLFVPTTVGFADGGSALAPFYRSTGAIGTEYFKYLRGEKTASEAFLLNPRTETYTLDEEGRVPIEPGEPSEPGPGGEEPEASLSYYLRRRYTSNFIVTEQIKLIDLMHEVIFQASRLFLSQAANGKIKINNKKPVDWALGTDEINGSEIEADDVSKWIGDLSGQLLVDPHTSESEVRAVTDANYSAAQNDVALSASANITVDGFAGCDGAHQAATATITVDSVTEENSFTLDNVTIDFIANTDADTVETIAAFIYGSINGHPRLQRKFRAGWEDDTVTIRAKFGTLTLESDLQFKHSVPLANPMTAPTISAASGGTLKAGTYKVAYSYVNQRGQTLLSPYASVTLTDNQKINVSAITPPSGATINWFVSPAENSRKLRLFLTNSGASFTIDSLPLLSAALPPDLNRTGCEVLRVAQVFSDRAETRSNISRSNVLKASFEWLLGSREKSVNRVDLKYRDATQDFRLIELRLRDDAHIKKTKKISNLVVNGQAIDSYHQAYRVASAILAEQRDADFFYKWTADREALLLEEGSVVCITDDGAKIVNLPVRIASIEFIPGDGFPKAQFVARKYSTTLYDDSVKERQIPVISENNNSDFTDALDVTYTPTNFVETRTLNADFDPETASFGDAMDRVKILEDVVGTLMDDLQNGRK